MKKAIIFVLFFCSTATAYETFYLKNASKKLDVKVEVAVCDSGFCKGEAKFSFYRKNRSKPFQIINLDNTQIWLDKTGNAQSNVTLLYDEQSVINLGDFNFDGFEDIALCDGTNGGYGMPSYRVYLFSKQQQKFIHNSSFTEIGQGPSLGMFEVDQKRKLLYRYSKSGCCWHQKEGFSVFKNRPKKVYEYTEDSIYENGTDGKKVVITTKKLVNGKWRVQTKKVRRES